MSEQFPKMATVVIGRKVVPIMRDGKPVVFANEDEERAFAGDGEPHHGRPEQHSHASPSYLYEAPPFTRVIHQRRHGEAP